MPRLYFHTEASRNGAPNAPAGSATLSEDPPDALSTAAAAIAGGHLSGSVANVSMLNKPAARDATQVTGTPPTVAPPAAAHQFGWFTDRKYSGSFQTGNWAVVARETDARSGITGAERICFFANKTRDWASPIRFLFQWVGATDWWTGLTQNTIAAQNASITGFTLSDEYLIALVWCNETVFSNAGQTFTFVQEGSDLTDAQRSNILTAAFTPMLAPGRRHFTPAHRRPPARAVLL